MTRVLCIDATQADVKAECADQGISLSAIETLESGGTRVVLLSSRDADALSLSYQGLMLTDAVRRTNVRFRHPEV